jgi:hypothetical protein
MQYVVKVLVVVEGSQINNYQDHVVAFPPEKQEEWPSKSFLDFQVQLAQSHHLQAAAEPQQLRRDESQDTLAEKQVSLDWKVGSFLESLLPGEVPFQ